MKSIRTEIVIDATPERVWTALTGFEGYREWNLCIRRIDGEARPDEALRITIRFGWLPPIRFRAQIDRFGKNKILGWRAAFLFGLLQGRHWFELHPFVGGKTRFVHCEIFSGALSILFFATMSGAIQQSYEAMNRALKARVEQK